MKTMDNLNTAVLLSIRPHWCELIANGQKTIELRKTKPKIQTPFKVFIYATKPKSNFDFALCRERESNKLGLICKCNYDIPASNGIEVLSGKVIGEFVCDWINEYTAEFVEDEDCYESIRQIFEDDGEEDFCTITSNEDDNPDICTLCIKSCLSFNDIKNYVGINYHDKKFYGWHISKLVIYDTPKSLSDLGLTRPPQSWCYVEVEK